MERPKDRQGGVRGFMAQAVNENLNAEQIKKALECCKTPPMIAKYGHCDGLE